jgi:hypothetical protein
VECLPDQNPEVVSKVMLLEGMQHSINTHKAYMRKKETEKTERRKLTQRTRARGRKENKMKSVISDSHNLK